MNYIEGRRPQGEFRKVLPWSPYHLQHNLLSWRIVGCGPNGGPAVRTPRAAEPEGEREVWRERFQGRVVYAWLRPRTRARARALQMYTPQMYTFGSGPIFWQGRASVLAVVLPAFEIFT